MSRTLDELLRSGEIEQVRVDLGPRRQSNRRLFVTKAVKEWINGLSNERLGGRLQSERDEIEAIFAEFIAGRPLTYICDVNPPAGEGIKKLKTYRFRLWGWAHQRQTFVINLACTKDDLKAKIIHERSMGKKALAIRNSLGVISSAKGNWSELFPSS